MSDTESGVYCPLPFRQLATLNDGAVKLCCRSWRVGSLQESRLMDIWNSQPLNEVRASFEKGLFPKECQACQKQEAHGVRSMRQRLVDAESSLVEQKKSTAGHGFPEELELKLSNLCNLRCVMCSPIDSSKWVKDWPQVRSLVDQTDHNLPSLAFDAHNLQKSPVLNAYKDNQAFWDDLKQMAPYLKRIKFAGGEPLLTPEHYKVLQVLAPYREQIELAYATNGSVVWFAGRDLSSYWEGFKSVHLTISIDGVGPVYEWIRKGARWENLKSCIEHFKTISNVQPLIGSCTFQALNIFHLPEIFEVLHFELGLRIHSHQVNSPDFLSSQALPLPMKDRVRKRIMTFIDKVEKEPQFSKVKKHILRHCQSNLRHMEAADLSHRWPDFLLYIERVSTGMPKWTNVFPEFKEFGLSHTSERSPLSP